MTWQEELRQLDSALAGGELSANDYRKRRDEILAAASSAQTPSPVLGPPPGPRAAEPTESDNGEVTQIVNTSEAEHGNEADSTQIISDPAGTAAPAETPAAGSVQTQTQAPAQAPAAAQAPAEAPAKTETPAEAPADNGDDEAERTQVITAATTAAADERTAPSVPQQQAPWTTTRPDANAPTGIFPRPAQPMLPPPTVTPMDAQDLFTSNKPPRGGGKPWLVGVIVLVVLALAGAAVWFFVLRDDATSNTADPNPTAEQPTKAPPPPVDIASIGLPGDKVKNSGEMDIAKASELKVIAPSEAALLADAGVGPLVYSGSSDGNYRYLLYQYKSDDAAGAKRLADAIAEVQKKIGLKPAQVAGVAEGVNVTQLTNKSASVLRGVYTYGDTTIQLSVLQVPAGDANELSTNFANTLKSVTDAATPGL